MPRHLRPPPLAVVQRPRLSSAFVSFRSPPPATRIARSRTPPATTTAIRSKSVLHRSSLTITGGGGGVVLRRAWRSCWAEEEMGNVGGKEGENGCDGPTMRSDGDPGFPPGADRVGRSLSLDPMGSSPPESPGRSRSPRLVAPQVPVAPLQRVLDASPIYNQSWTNNSHGHLDMPIEKGIPTLIAWNYGGNDVAVEGSWDNWMSRKALQRTGKDHTLLLVLPSGVYHYRFIIDGEWRYMPDLPCITDEMGRISNLLDVTNYVPENLDSISEFECPPSPDSSYSQSFPMEEDFAKEPPALPPQLHLTAFGSQSSEEASKKPQHVVLNHLFIEKGWASQSLVALGLNHRFQSKYVTVVLYKPLRKQ